MKILVLICVFLLAITKACADTNDNDGNVKIRASGYFSWRCKNWCKNGGICTVRLWRKICSCPCGYKGPRCQYKSGEWISWGPWSTCTRTCGQGYQFRHGTCVTRRRKKQYQKRKCSQRPCSVNGNWGTWDTWSTCTKTCGPGIRMRTRACDNPPPSYGGLDCLGCNDETSECNTQPCPVDGNWAQWSQWGSCSKTCGTGIRNRTRACDNPPPDNSGAQCPGNDTDSMECNTEPCSVDGNWSQWSQWSCCSKTCGTGTRNRTRACDDPPPSNGGAQCPGNDTVSMECNTEPCPVDGNWSQWSQWSSCSKTCGTGTRNRTRACDDPSPANGGAQCPGNDTDSMECNTEPCPVDGNWGQWSQWSSCTKTCGTGIRNRTRACDDPFPGNGGAQCPGNDTDSMECNTEPCPVDGNWGQWSQWSSCSKNCGTGTRNRTQACDDPAPANGGAQCPGNDTDSMECNTEPCPVGGNWGQWGQWSSCSKTCGTGTRNRTRACDDPLPANGGAQCPGNDTESMECNTEPCPEDGSWGSWRPWSVCSSSCGTGSRGRIRVCDSPPPTNGGALCPGPYTELSSCNTQPCPAVDGNWGEWNQLEACSTTCGPGFQIRSRVCDNPFPANGGAPCPGSSSETLSCNLRPCSELA